MKKIKMVGDFEVIDGDGFISSSDSLKEFGWYHHVKMFDNTTKNDSEWETYCLMKRFDNGEYFFAEIVDAPELGKGQTKFHSLKTENVPNVIVKYVQSLFRDMVFAI